VEKKAENNQPEKIEQKDEKVMAPKILVETTPEAATEKPKPKELSKEEIQKIIDDKKERPSVQIGKLTQENLDEKFKTEKNNTPKFEENDIETESIMMD